MNEILERRAAKLRGVLDDAFEAAIIKTPQNRFWLLDFDSHDAGTLVVLPHESVFIIDSRYIEAAQKSITCAEVLLETDVMAQVMEILSAANVSCVQCETDISVAEYSRLQQSLPGFTVKAEPGLSAAFGALRAVKDSEEVTRMRQAQRLTDDCFSHILPFIKEGVREIDLALEMEHYMRSHGAEGIAFDTICVAGTKSSLPHGVPGDNRVALGDLITFDFGAKVRGYCADMTRTVAFGQPAQDQRNVYDTVLKAHLAGIDAVRAGRVCSEVDRVARDIIYAAGYKGYFGHGLGHAVGIDVHENPRFSPKSDDTIAAGMMMTVEPGIYLPGHFGCRIEDTVLVTENGCEPLPATPKELLVL